MTVTQVAPKIEEIAAGLKTIEIELGFIAAYSAKVKSYAPVQDGKTFGSCPGSAVFEAKWIISYRGEHFIPGHDQVLSVMLIIEPKSNRMIEILPERKSHDCPAADNLAPAGNSGATE